VWRVVWTQRGATMAYDGARRRGVQAGRSWVTGASVGIVVVSGDWIMARGRSNWRGILDGKGRHGSGAQTALKAAKNG
jgi:hypothetical protein